MRFGFVPDYFHAEVVEKIPLDRLLLETDSPYFLPRSIRDKVGFNLVFGVQLVVYF